MNTLIKLAEDGLVDGLKRRSGETSKGVKQVEPAIELRRRSAKRSLDRMAAKLQTHGAMPYSGHERVRFAKKLLSERDLKGLGFSSSYSSIPEPGQSRFVSFRGPGGLHIHDHGEDWIMHRDAHNPKQLRDIPSHIIEEALPTLKDYISWDKGSLSKHLPRLR